MLEQRPPEIFVIQAFQSSRLVPEISPHRADFHRLAAGADLMPAEAAQMPRNFAASDDLRIRRQQIFEQGRAAATIAADIDKLCQCRPLGWNCLQPSGRKKMLLT
jgi:hypothetical protein